MTQYDDLKYGFDKGSPDGDFSALTIKRGDKLFTFTGEEAEAIQALILAERRAAGVEERTLALSYMKDWKYKDDYLKKSLLISEASHEN